MSEVLLQNIASLKLLTVAIFATMYGWGGMISKPIRRVGGSLFLTSAIVGFSLWTQTFNWWICLYALLLWGALSMGYGATKTKDKIIKRTYCGLAYALASLPIAIVTSAWVLFALHTVMCVGVSVTLGVINPVHARYEETLIGATIATLPLFMV